MKTQQIYIGNTKLKVKVAKSSEEHALGLQNTKTHPTLTRMRVCYFLTRKQKFSRSG